MKRRAPRLHHEEAARLSQQLDSIRQAVRRDLMAAAERYPVRLTAPQVQALEVLVDELRESGGGLSMSELSRRMHLAHSTVSGIVSRLEARGLVERAQRGDDRRYVSVELTEPVREWLQRELPSARVKPLAAALARASASERAAILDGVAVLERLLRTEG